MWGGLLLLGWCYCCADKGAHIMLMNRISFISLIRKEVGRRRAGGVCGYYWAGIIAVLMRGQI